jgi:sigma-B regulation protein RsbU (phosphoserine phosphatase)
MAHILVVEDEPGIALGLEDSLRLEGHEVEVIADGVCAAKRACHATFDLILLDVMLPGKSGFEICKELRAAGTTTPIILLTARVLERDRILGLDLGANDYVTKPFSPRELMARVRALLRYTEDNRRDRRNHDEELCAALDVQQRLLPNTQPDVPNLDYVGVCRPALGVSGDYYDFISLESGMVALLLADVSGKGMPAALLGASLHAAVRAWAQALGSNCGEVLARANRLLFETTSSDKYATVFYCVYDHRTQNLTYANAGHCAPLMAVNGGCNALDSLTPPVGMFADIPVRQQTIHLVPGTRLIIASDGVTEACNASDEEFGDTRLRNLLERWSHASAAEFCGNVLDALTDFRGGTAQTDDISLIAARLTA